jgi:hypothetical protein
VSDLVGTCPKDFWEEWIAEGGCAGDPPSKGLFVEWGWGTGSRLALKIEPGERFYVVAHGRLRGWAPVVAVERFEGEQDAFEIIRRFGAVACTVPFAIPGFRGLRRRWWKREEEQPFENWRRP